MSKIGKKPIELQDNIEYKEENGFIIVKGPKGELKQKSHDKVNIEKKDKELIVSVKNESDKGQRALWGLYQRLISNMVNGVTQGWSKKLEINGVGFKAVVQGKKLILNVGFSHPVNFDIPEGINITVEKNEITVTGINKQIVGEVSAQIRAFKKPEPYKGKGIKYSDEVIRRKAGKTAS